MDCGEVDAEMERLEAAWFDALRASQAASQELQKLENGESPDLLGKALDHFNVNEVAKRDIMRRIVELEDSLVGLTAC